MDAFMPVIYSPLAFLTYPLLKKELEKKVTSDEDLHELSINTLNKPIQCGAVCPFEEKIELATTEHVTDYHSHIAENGKNVLCFTSPELKAFIQTIIDRLTTERALTFKPLKARLYLNLSDEQHCSLSLSKKVHLKVSVSGVFTQSSDNIIYLEMELTAVDVFQVEIVGVKETKL